MVTGLSRGARLSVAWVALVAAFACDTSDRSPEVVRVHTAPLRAWVDADFNQVLRVHPGESKVRGRCEITVPLDAPRPMAFIAAGDGVDATVGWKGPSRASGRLSVSECAAYPCEVNATFRLKLESGEVGSCQISADDGTTRFVGNATGSALTVGPGLVAPGIFQQGVKFEQNGMAVSGRCTFRQNVVLPAAEVTGLEVRVDGVTELSVGSFAIGGVSFPERWSPLPFGTVYVGSEGGDGGPGVTRLKHVAPRKEQLRADDGLWCAGTYHTAPANPAFDVNVTTAPAGKGMTIATAPTGRTCPIEHFGTGDGCDCDCGIVDPDCAPEDVCASPDGGAPGFALRGTVVPGAGRAIGGAYELRGALSPNVRPRVSAGAALTLTHGALTRP